MKTTFTLLFSLLIVLTVKSQSYTWTNGGGDNDFENGANWSPTPLFGYPSFGETAVFDGAVSNANCNILNPQDFTTLSMLSSYTGTLDASAVDLTLVSASLQGGTLLCPANILLVSGNLVKSASASFVCSPTSILQYDLSSSTLRTINGSFNLNFLEILTSGSAGSRAINFSAGTSTCVTVSLNGGTYPMAYRGTINITNGLTIAGTSTSEATTNTGVFSFIGAGAKTITGTASPLQNRIASFNFNTTGSLSMSGNITAKTLWSVSNIGSFISGSSTVTMLGGTITGGSTSTSQARFDNLSTSTGSTTIFTGSSIVNLTGNLVNNGTITQNTSLLRLSGSGSQSISGASTTTLNALEVSNSGTKTLSSAVQLLDSAKVSAAGTLACGGNLTLKSTSALKARIAEIVSGGSVTGNISVETFIPGGTAGWANLGPAGISGLSVPNWDGGSGSSTGIAMTCNGCINNETSAGGYFVSIQGDPTGTGVYTELTSASALTPGVGYWVFVGSSLTTAIDITQTNSGSIVSGPVSSGTGFMSNPYPSPISLDRLKTHNAGLTSVDVYDANTGAFTSFNGGLPSAAVIPMGQGFYANGATTVNFTEADKVANNTASFGILKVAATSASVGVVLQLNINAPNGDQDKTYVRFHGGATPTFDNDLDAYKRYATPGYLGYPGPYSKYTTIATVNGGQDYSINSLPYALTSNAVIPVVVKVFATGVYTISPIGISTMAVGGCIILKDKLLGVNHDLRTGPYVCSINDTTSVARFELTVCADLATGINQVSQSASSLILINQDLNGAYVKTSFESETKATISAYNMMGQKLIEDKEVEGKQTTTYLNLGNVHSQVVIIKVTTAKESSVKKLFVN
jgi:hypothetical protein